MKYLKYKCLLAIILGCSLSGCFDLTEEVFDRVDSGVYYQDENSVKSAVATIYSTGATSYAEYFWYMQEFPADQVTWRVWNGGQWGVEFLNEGRRRRTDLRRFDKFTQGQWWFFGRATDNGQLYPAKRDRKYEWYPLPASALLVNQGLIQNPNYK